MERQAEYHDVAVRRHARVSSPRRERVVEVLAFVRRHEISAHHIADGQVRHAARPVNKRQHNAAIGDDADWQMLTIRPSRLSRVSESRPAVSHIEN
jgi:hypothetical protein